MRNFKRHLLTLGNRSFGIAIIVFIAGTIARGEDDAHLTQVWNLVAESELIVTATLSVPESEIRSSLESSDHRYVEMSFSPEVVLKGLASNPPIIRWYTKPRSYKPGPEQVLALNGETALLFLIYVRDPYARGYYFAGHTTDSLQGVSEAQLSLVHRIVREQDDALKKFRELFPPEREPLYETVKGLVDDMTDAGTQHSAFAQLEALGSQAIPSIIMLMDDRRDLADPSISLRNDFPDAFEAFRHYGPEKVVDALAAILNQITGESFGTIYNGGTEQERANTIKAWRLFLIRESTQGTDRDR